MHRRDEGELWSLNFEGRVFCCWKCGSPTHIGDKCRDQDRTFEEVFSSNASEGLAQPTWAAVVRSGNGDAQGHRNRVTDMELRLGAYNKKKARELEESENKRRQEEQEVKDREAKAAQKRQLALQEVAKNAKEALQATTAEKKGLSDEGLSSGGISDTELLEEVSKFSGAALPPEPKTNMSKALVLYREPPRQDAYFQTNEALQAGLRAYTVASRHVEWLRSRQDLSFHSMGMVDTSSHDHGHNKHRLALEYKPEEDRIRKRAKSVGEHSKEGFRNADSKSISKPPTKKIRSVSSNSVRIKSSESKKLKFEEDTLWNDAVGAMSFEDPSTRTISSENSSDEGNLVIDIMSSPDKDAKS